MSPEVLSPIALRASLVAIWNDGLAMVDSIPAIPGESVGYVTVYAPYFSGPPMKRSEVSTQSSLSGERSMTSLKSKGGWLDPHGHGFDLSFALLEVLLESVQPIRG